MTWVRRVEAVERHECDPPEAELPDCPVAVRPTGNVGDLWRCDECGKLWRIAGERDSPFTYEWRRASHWQRFRHRGSG